MAGDLDAADLGEVRRRVVDPVLLAGLRPGELDDVELTFGPPRSWSGFPVDADDVPDVWLTVVARGETFSTRPVRATFERWPAYDVAASLTDQLEDWLAETGFAWGQRRVVDIGPTVPQMAGRRPGARGRAIEVHPDPASPSLLWDGSRGLDPIRLGLSAPLVDALARWRARWQDLADHGAWGLAPDGWPWWASWNRHGGTWSRRCAVRCRPATSWSSRSPWMRSPGRPDSARDERRPATRCLGSSIPPQHHHCASGGLHARR